VDYIIHDIVNDGLLSLLVARKESSPALLNLAWAGVRGERLKIGSTSRRFGLDRFNCLSIAAAPAQMRGTVGITVPSLPAVLAKGLSRCPAC
jgi:hypothetical protein